MNSSSLASLPLRCPLSGSSLELLDNDREILAINEAIEKGDLTLAAGTIPKGAIDSILISADGSKRVCVVMQGNHRVAVMSFLGFKSIAIKPGVTCLGFVHESEVESWPLVKAGVVSVNCALEIFNFFIRK